MHNGITTTHSNHANQIIPVASPQEVFELREKLLKEGYNKILLGGERNSVKIPGFDLDSSPLFYSEYVALLFFHSATCYHRNFRFAKGNFLTFGKAKASFAFLSLNRNFATDDSQYQISPSDSLSDAVALSARSEISHHGHSADECPL